MTNKVAEIRKDVIERGYEVAYPDQKLLCDRIAELEEHVRVLRKALDAIARAYDPSKGCSEDCASWRDDDCDCGYVDAATDLVEYAREALAATEDRDVGNE